MNFKLIVGLSVLIGIFSCKKKINAVEKKEQPVEQIISNFLPKKSIEEVTLISDSLIYEAKENSKTVYLASATKLFLIGKFDKANDYLHLAINSKDKTTSENEANIYYLAGLIASEKKLNYQALYNFNKAGDFIHKHELFHTIPNKSDVLLLHIALKNIELNFYESGRKYVGYAEDISNKFNSKNEQAKSDLYLLKSSFFIKKEFLNKDSLEYYLSKSGQPNSLNHNYIKAEYFYNSKQMDSSEIYLNKIKELSNEEFSALDYTNLLSVQVNQNKLNDANETVNILNQKLKFEKLSIPDSLIYLENITEYYIATNQKEKAQENLDKYASLKDNFFRVENAKNINELSTLIDIETKEKEIDSISKHVKKIGFTLERRNQALLIALLIILIVIVLYAFNRIRSKNKQLELEQTKVKLASTNHDLEMKLLKNQMNPHFIFNSLSAIQSNIRQNKNEKALNYLGKFSGLMRLTLESTRKPFSSLQEEIELAEKYIQLQKLRKENFEYKIDISELAQQDMDIIAFPAFSLQPFIENSILHGFVDSNHQGILEIKIDLEGDYLIAEIIDNGVGLNQTESLHSSQAISIIKERLNLFDKEGGTQSTLTIENRKDTSGVRVYLKVPIRELG